MPTIDLNCDLGEGAGSDDELMPLISSANIACGGHAGDDTSMRTTVELARRYSVAIGAHPSFEDRADFGRREQALTAAEIRRLVREQTSSLRRFGPILHVKPHGALYNLAARSPEVARAVAEGVKDVDPGLRVFALAGSELVRAATACGLRVAEEVFVDRSYADDGTLTPRSHPGALVQDEAAVVQQLLAIVTTKTVHTLGGRRVPIVADTVCLHGDGPHAVAFARRIRRTLDEAGVQVAALPAR